MSTNQVSKPAGSQARARQDRMVERALREWGGQVDGKVAVVTGGARGLGEVMGRALSRVGAKVVAIDKSWAGADALRQSLEAGCGLAVEADITSDASLNAAYGQVMEKYGTVDILINNAALVSETLFPPTGHRDTLDTTDEDWEAMFRVNVFGTVKVTRRFVVPMREKRQGSIINIVSSGVLAVANGGAYFGARPWTAEMPYQATKAAVTVFGFYLGEELQKEGIAVNSIMPGHTRTSWFDTTARAFNEGGIVYFNRPVVSEHLLPLTLFLSTQSAEGATGRLYFAPEWNYDYGYGDYAAWQDQELPGDMEAMYGGLEAATPPFGRSGVSQLSFDAQSALFVAGLGALKKQEG